MLIASIGIGQRLSQYSQNRSAQGRYEDPDPMGDAGRMADWIEASCLLGSGVVSRTDCVDELGDSGALGDNEAALEEAIGRGFQQVSVRSALRRPWHPIKIDSSGRIIRRETKWRERPEYLFMLLTSMTHLSPDLAIKGTTWHEVGHLFEELVGQSVVGLLRAPAEVLPVSKKGPAGSFASRVEATLGAFRRSIREEARKAPNRIKDAGVDLFARIDLGDDRPGVPHVLIQCAAGDNWRIKLRQTSLATWHDYVDWAGPVLRAIAVPVAFGDEDRLREVSRDAEWGLIFDRQRILEGLIRNPLPKGLRTKVTAWCMGRIEYLDGIGAL